MNYMYIYISIYDNFTILKYIEVYDNFTILKYIEVYNILKCPWTLQYNYCSGMNQSIGFLPLLINN
ncbi:hypothetical protein D3C87_762550 [compost metagenome]